MATSILVVLLGAFNLPDECAFPSSEKRVRVGLRLKTFDMDHLPLFVHCRGEAGCGEVDCDPTVSTEVAAGAGSAFAGAARIAELLGDRIIGMARICRTILRAVRHI